MPLPAGVHECLCLKHEIVATEMPFKEYAFFLLKLFMPAQGGGGSHAGLAE